MSEENRLRRLGLEHMIGKPDKEIGAALEKKGRELDATHRATEAQVARMTPEQYEAWAKAGRPSLTSKPTRPQVDMDQVRLCAALMLRQKYLHDRKGFRELPRSAQVFVALTLAKARSPAANV